MVLFKLESSNPPKAKSPVKDYLILVGKAHKYFSKELKSLIPEISHKQVEYLREQLPQSEWQVSWNKEHKWAIIPKEENALWSPLFERLPKSRKEYLKAIECRKTALLELRDKLIVITEEIKKLPCRRGD
uniref:Uncharacterized protein n=1 Tax=Caulerpa lentillifera TaxID=148947 RepID=A0A345HH05_9CHLO|nr:hypothetical protein [Caulerpa lentillifera]AXG75895.1 hypothetical protein [Caulerpa lentillifera]QKS32305.1 hypothetical protein [Caulerpa lentillifera]QUV75639.1 hypothetical protein [Caulerpa lentillifera]